MKIDIRDPDPDTANFPNGAYTLPKGRLYIENSPVGFYAGSRNGNQPPIYQWEYLLRYGLTDNLEFRLFSNGLTYQAGQGKQPAITGYSPLAFDFKANFWEENTRYHIPGHGARGLPPDHLRIPGVQQRHPAVHEPALRPEPALRDRLRIQLRDHGGPEQSGANRLPVQLPVVVPTPGCQGLRHLLSRLLQCGRPAAIPASSRSRLRSARIPNVTVMGLGAIKTVNDRFAIFGSYNFGVTPASPKTIALLGFAVAF